MKSKLIKLVSIGLLLFSVLAVTGCSLNKSKNNDEPELLSNPVVEPTDLSKNVIGMNLAGFNDWSPAWALTDRMKYAREWITYPVGTTEWDEERLIDIPADENGYPIEVPFIVDGESYLVKTLIFRSGHYPAGEYTLLFDGTGEVSINFDASGIFTDSENPNHFTVVTPTFNSGILVSILKSSKEDPIKNIRVIMPGYENTYEQNVFHPEYLERVKIFDVIRFGWWGKVWGNETVEWSEVPTKDYYLQNGDAGVSPEYMIELCNEIEADPWIGIPHLANNEYVTELATLIRDKMEPGRKIYIEYSNEVWNPMKIDHNYVIDRGMEANLSLIDDRFQAGLLWYARRSGEVFKIFEDVFGGADRIVKVVGSQAANIWTGQTVLEGLNDPIINPTGVKADVLAIAPYFGGTIGDDIFDNGEVDSITVEDILDRLEATLYSETEAWTKANSDMITEFEFGVELIAYEGGPHLVANYPNYNNETLVNKLIAANRHPRMKDIQIKMFDIWFANGGQLFTGFDFCEAPGVFGSFAVLEYLDQPIDEAPKYSAYVDYISTH